VSEPKKRTHLTDEQARSVVQAYVGGASLRVVATSHAISYGLAHRTVTISGVYVRPRGGPRKKATK
jgi:hypothetical protein